jgi:hypothetical protein
MAKDDTGYKRGYKLHFAVTGAKTLHVTFPHEVVAREAAIHGLTVGEFIKKYEAVAEFIGSEVKYTFREMKEAGNAE